jgi:hypothetical protein
VNAAIANNSSVHRASSLFIDGAEILGITFEFLPSAMIAERPVKAATRLKGHYESA